MRHGENSDETYRIRWTLATKATARLATEAQPFRAALLGGGEIEFAGNALRRPTVLVFWASWCEPCLDEAPHLVRLHARYGAQVDFVSVSIDDPDHYEKLRGQVSDLGVTYPVALDADGATILPLFATATGIPLTFVFGDDRRTRYSHRNYQDGDEHALEQAIAEVVREK